MITDSRINWIAQRRVENLLDRDTELGLHLLVRIADGTMDPMSIACGIAYSVETEFSPGHVDRDALSRLATRIEELLIRRMRACVAQCPFCRNRPCICIQTRISGRWRCTLCGAELDRIDCHRVPPDSINSPYCSFAYWSERGIRIVRDIWERIDCP